MPRRHLRQGRGGAMGGQSTVSEGFTMAGFVSSKEGGAVPETPMFQLDRRQVAEFLLSKHSVFASIVSGLIEREAWMMLLPPHEGVDSWSLFVEVEHVSYIERRLINEVEGLYLTRGPHCPAEDTNASDLAAEEVARRLEKLKTARLERRRSRKRTATKTTVSVSESKAEDASARRPS
jgi:hypothetical protein